MKYFPVVSPVSHVTSQRGVQPGNKVDPISPCAAHCIYYLMTLRWDVFRFMRVFTVCFVILEVGGGVFINL